jgi:hypothetical protein
MNMKSDENSKRGPKHKQSDRDLMEIALEIKNKIKNQVLTPSLLERETGIGRNTWNRRIKKYLDDINQPISRQLGLSDDDTIYFPNVEALFELYGNNKPRLISELHKFELLLQDIYKERTKYKKQAEGYFKYKSEVDNLHHQMNKLQDQLNFYKSEYEKMSTSSIDPELRKRYGYTENVLSFQEHSEKYLALDQLKSFFPESSSKENIIDDSKNNIEMIESMFPDLFDPQ